MRSEAGCLSVPRGFQFSGAGILRFLNEEVMSAQIDRVKGKAGALKAGPFSVWQTARLPMEDKKVIFEPVFGTRMYPCRA